MTAKGSKWSAGSRALLRAPALLLAIALALLLDPRLAIAQNGPSAGCQLTDGEDRTVTRIIDAETIALDGGNEARLVGALAPRAFDSASTATEWPLADHAREVLQEIMASRSVRLAFAGRRTDRYGRLLAHVFANRDGAQTWVQGEMLKRGLARAYAIEGSTACLAELIAHETIAREQAIGIWAEPTYAIRDADDIVSLLRLSGTFQIVEGKVASVSDVRGTTYLNFGEDWRQDFTVVMRTPARRTITSIGMKSEDLTGRRIRARGWIERRGGPLIDLAHAAAIEVLANEQASAPVQRRRGRRSTHQQ